MLPPPRKLIVRWKWPSAKIYAPIWGRQFPDRRQGRGGGGGDGNHFSFPPRSRGTVWQKKKCSWHCQFAILASLRTYSVRNWTTSANCTKKWATYVMSVLSGERRLESKTEREQHAWEEESKAGEISMLKCAFTKKSWSQLKTSGLKCE